MYETSKLEIIKSEIEDWPFSLRSCHQLDKKLDSWVSSECSAAPVASGYCTTLFTVLLMKSTERFVHLALEASAGQLIAYVAVPVHLYDNNSNNFQSITRS